MRFKLLFLMFIILFSFPFTALSQQEKVRMVYFYAKDRPIDEAATQKRMEDVAKILTSFYKGIIFEKSGDNFVIHFVQGKQGAGDYILNSDSPEDQMLAEIHEEKGFNLFKDLYLVITNVDAPGRTCGTGGIISYTISREGSNSRLLSESAWAFVYEESDCVEDLIYYLAAHELGHALGLGHDFSNRNHIMSYGVEEVKDPNGIIIWKTPYLLSDCSMHWLRASRFINLDSSPTSSSNPGVIELADSPGYNPVTKELHVSLTGAGVPSLHQVQLHLIPETTPDGFYPVSENKDNDRDWNWDNLRFRDKLSLDQCHDFENDQMDKNHIVFEDVDLSKTPPNDLIEITWIDTHGNVASRIIHSSLIIFDDALEKVETLSTESLTSDPTQDSRLLATLEGHTDFVSSIAFSRDGEKPDGEKPCKWQLG